MGGANFYAVHDFFGRDAHVQQLLHLYRAAESRSVDKISIASGLAIYDPEKDENFQSVFERADSEMYKSKIAMKGGRANIR